MHVWYEMKPTGVAPLYEVEGVLSQKGSANQRQLLVRWKGYGAEHDQWQRRSELVRSAPIAVQEFDARQGDGSFQTAQLVLAARTNPETEAA